MCEGKNISDHKNSQVHLLVLPHADLQAQQKNMAATGISAKIPKFSGQKPV